jgi:hypothetical protein
VQNLARSAEGESRIVQVLKGEIALSVKRGRGLAEVSKTEKSPIIEEETSGRRLRSYGEGTSEGLQKKTRIFMIS